MCDRYFCQSLKLENASRKPKNMPRMNRRKAISLGVAGILGLSGWFAPSAHAAWPFRKQYGMFIVHADFAPDGYLPLFEELVGLRDEVANRLGITPCNEQIDVYLFSSKPVYENYMSRYFPGVSPRRAMFIKSNSPGNVFAYASRDIATDLRHETTHALLHASLPMVPLWLDEGLAEYFEVPAAQRERGNPYARSTRRELTWKRPTPLAQLERMTKLQQMGSSEYREAWSWVHFMLHGPEPARVALHDYFESVQRHEPPMPLSQSLGTKLRSPEHALATHFGATRR